MMTREAIIETVKKKYARADVATIDAVLRALQETDFYLPAPTSLAHQSVTHQAVVASAPQLNFIGENLSPEAYRKLSFDERGALNERLQEQNRQWLEEKFSRLHAAWLIVMDGEVIASGDSLHNYPRIEQIREIISRYGKQPFIFINDLFVAIEESHSNWNPTVYRRDFYPTVSLTLRTDSGSVEIVADFDTGAASSFIDLDLLLSHQVIDLYESENVVSSKHLGESFRYVSKPINVEIKLSTGEPRTLELPIQCIGNWNGSPFVRINPRRTALAGRDIFLQLQPSILLDFANRRTKISAPETA
jgi:hypothetical protein